MNTDNMQQYNHVGVIIVAGGSGSRLGGSLPKQFLLLDGRPVLARTIDNFARALQGASIVAVLPERYIPFWQDYAARFDVARHKAIPGGEERTDSVRNGLEALSGEHTIVVVQDGVRPLASDELILRTVRCAAMHGTAVPVVDAVDSYRRRTDADGGSEVIDRRDLLLVQTPQAFDAGLLRKAYAQTDRPASDDATLVERLGTAIRLCPGERTNIKITTREDLELASALLALRRADDESDADDGTENDNMGNDGTGNGNDAQGL